MFFAGMVPQAANCRGFWMVRDACEPKKCMQNVFDIDYVHINIIYLYIYIEVQNVDK